MVCHPHQRANLIIAGCGHHPGTVDNVACRYAFVPELAFDIDFDTLDCDTALDRKSVV